MLIVVAVAMDAVREEEEAAATMVVVAETDVAGAEVPQVQNPKPRATELTFLRSDTSPLDLCSPSRHSEPMNLINLSILGS